MSGQRTGFAHWLHLQWPSGQVEPLPEVAADFSTNVPGLFIVGDLTGIPLLKFSVDSGTRVVRSIGKIHSDAADDQIPLVIIGAGVAGVAASIEAHRLGIEHRLLESSRLLDTVENFPVGKPIFTCPPEMKPAGDLQLPAGDLDREGLLESLREQAMKAGIEPILCCVESVRTGKNCLQVCCEDGQILEAKRVVIAIGRSGNYRKLGVVGEDLEHVSNRLHDPADHHGQAVLVVGGGDSACEAAVALADEGARVTLSHRGDQLVRPSSANVERVGERVDQKTLQVESRSEVLEISSDSVTLTGPDGPKQIEASSVYTLIGREAPLEFLRRSGVRIRGEWTARSWCSLLLVLAFCTLLFHWKRPGVWLPISEWWSSRGGFPQGVDRWWSGLGGSFSDPATWLGTLATSVGEAGFWYSLLYTLIVLVFGMRRIRRRPTPYVRWQTWTLISIQALPLFLLPYLLLPWLGNNGLFDDGWARSIVDALFPVAEGYGPGREYWRAFGLILAWPLFFWNVFTDQPLMAWLVISLVQTFVLLPLAIWRWGKGVYCGWICSCGALAETLGDTQRRKMPHGILSNRLNFIGQFLLLLCFLMLDARLCSWLFPGSTLGNFAEGVYSSILIGIPLFSYEWTVDVLLSGILGVGLYWHFSGRVWCRFACPLAALMNIYARFSRFRIISEKARCISCNVCTAVCHQGVDVMSFAQRGLAVADPQCVRCSACIEECPTAVLAFGEVDGEGRVIRLDTLAAVRKS
ncbi:MAG: NAD(P)-binding domain-containing protein [Planctomycetota bacterium]|nr:NAD(P)-binding domain-containing protein [Planctomycetota bacterium]